MATNRQRIPSEHSKTLDCFASLAMTNSSILQESPIKIVLSYHLPYHPFIHKLREEFGEFIDTFLHDILQAFFRNLACIALVQPRNLLDFERRIKRHNAIIIRRDAQIQIAQLGLLANRLFALQTRLGAIKAHLWGKMRGVVVCRNECRALPRCARQERAQRHRQR